MDNQQEKIDQILSIVTKIDAKLNKFNHETISTEIRDKIIDYILNSKLNITLIPDKIEREIYDCIFDIVLKYLPIP
jgi:hypothetical protein